MEDLVAATMFWLAGEPGGFRTPDECNSVAGYLVGADHSCSVLLGLIKAEHEWAAEDPGLAGVSSLDRAAWYWKQKQEMDREEAEAEQARAEQEQAREEASDEGGGYWQERERERAAQAEQAKKERAAQAEAERAATQEKDRAAQAEREAAEAAVMAEIDALREEFAGCWSSRTPEDARRIADEQVTYWSKSGPKLLTKVERLEWCRDHMLREIKYNQEAREREAAESRRANALYDADRFPFIKMADGTFKSRGRGKPRPGQQVVYFTAAEATERGLDLPPRPGEESSEHETNQLGHNGSTSTEVAPG